MTDNFGCVNNTIRLRSGAYLDLADPQPDDFEFSDIAGSLAKICRFGGQCNRFYSVAEHSIHCAAQAARDGLSLDVQAALLMHDATEAFIGDCVKPLKIMLPDYMSVEAKMEQAISRKFDIDFARHGRRVTEIDRCLLIAERRAMFDADHVTWTGENEVRQLSISFEYWQPSDVEMIFTSYAEALGVIE